MEAQRPWHRLFGLSLVDFFRGMPVTVELEKDLSLKQQLLDVVIIRTDVAALPTRLPDGFEKLATHNLVTFKSYQEALDGWSLNELLGHYVNYRKQVSASMQDLLPETVFRLFAVSVRFPQGLARDVPMVQVQPGVYDVRHFSGLLRIIVVHELARQEHNALLHLFSARADLLEYGATHYRQTSQETSTLLLQLIERYRLEARLMPDMLEQLAEKTINELLKKLPPEKRLKGVTAEERLKGVTAEERLKGVPVEERLKGLPAEERLKGLSPEERLKGLSLEDLLAALPPERRAALAKHLKETGK